MTLQKIWILLTGFNYGFPKILRMNNDYFPTQQLLVGFCEGEALYCMCVCVWREVGGGSGGRQMVEIDLI